MKVYIIWVTCVIAWNYGVPGAEPVEDVLAAILLSILSVSLKKYIK